MACARLKQRAQKRAQCSRGTVHAKVACRLLVKGAPHPKNPLSPQPKAISSPDLRRPPMKNDFKGNKQFLPSKLCAVCGRTMTWRKAWAKNWESVLYCSDACRAKKMDKKSH